MITIDSVEICEIKNKIVELQKSSDIYLVGYGLNGKLLEEWFIYNNFSLNGIIDLNEKETAYGRTTNSYESIMNHEKDAFYILSSGSIHYKDMNNQLILQGVESSHIIRLDYKTLYTIIIDLNKKYGNNADRKYNKSLHNKHIHRRVFLVGNGPSLQIEDLDKLKNEISFATNEIFGAFKYTTWRPTYYVIEDRMGAMKNYKTLEKLRVMSKNTDMILCSELTHIYRDFDISHGDNICFYTPDLKNRGSELMPFSTDIEAGVSVGEGTSVYSMYQFAVDMGASEIYLIGMDCNYPKVIDEKGNIEIVSEKNAHASFIAECTDESGVVANYNKMIRDHMSAKAFADKHGIKIYNATRGGKLEVFERVDFDSLFK